MNRRERMQQGETINLLVSCESQARLEALLGLFRDAGQATRAHRVASLRNLGELLRDPQWDLLIVTDRHPEITPAEALALLAERQSDVPGLALLATPDADGVLACLRQGAREAMGADERERLLHATLREVRAVREHRELARLRVQYEEIARRAELLLAASQDAIAYVVDGMHVHANDLYATLFGYASVDELSSVPLVDLIAAGRQQDFKDALRRYRANPQQQTAIDFAGVRADGGEFAGQLVLSTASYEGEPCMQVLVRAGPAAAPAGPSPQGVAAAPGGLEALRAAIAGARGAQLLLFAVDGYAQHCRNLGVRAAARLVDELGAFMRQVGGWGVAPLRVADAVLALVLRDGDADAAASLGREAIEQVAGHIHAVGSQSVTCSICVAVAALDSAAADAAEATLDRAWGTLLATAERASSARAADAQARLAVLATPAARAPASAGAGAGDPDLAEAVRQGRFRVLFQPIVSLRGDASEYYEVRVTHVPSGKPAGDWLAESNLADASLELDKWVVLEALRNLAAHRGKHPATRLLLPVGAGAVLEPEFGDWLALALRAAELPADCVALQLSHRSVGSNLRQAKQLAELLQGLGCQLCVSGIHSANNPLADLVHLKPQFARIDPALSQALKDPESTNTLLKPLVESLHQEQIASIMPEVEGASVLAVLWQLGVNFIQGDYLQPPQADMHYDFTDLA
jgi:PAS domain S-box-containing protein